MRLAVRALRHVQLKALAHCPRAALLTPLQTPCVNGFIRNSRFPLIADRGIRPFSTTGPLRALADHDLIYPDLPHVSKNSAAARVALEPTTTSTLVLESRAFRRWSALLTDPARLVIESDFSRQGPAKDWHSRLLVDKFEHRGDIALWSCLLDFQVRINGPTGALRVWKALWGRKTLYDVESPLAAMFWRVMLESALTCDDPSVLETIWFYSEWMYDLHKVKWPQLYTTVIKHMLRTHQHQQALQWQLRLSTNFYPGSDEFTAIIKEFALDEELYRLDTLPSLYKTNTEKNMYSSLLPYLFNHGKSQLAREWRRVFIRHGDVPQVPASIRPFLRFLRGYHPTDTLISKELAALEFITESKNEKVPDLSQEFVNRVHGKTFGITVKNYNDRIGSKWLATSFVSLDLAISAISALGVQTIGPLSLQSIALRAGDSANVLNQISQLRERGISVADSNYYQIIFYLARQNDNELLFDLLRSDIHPDVFDDMDVQTRMIESATDLSDWRTLRLLLVARLVLFERSSRAVANDVLRIRFQQRSQDGVLQILGDMKAKNIPLNFEEASRIYDSLIEDYNIEQRALTSQTASFYVSIFRQLKSMDIPVPLSHWRLVMLNMIRRGRLEDLERLSVELVDMFISAPSMRPGFAPLHLGDLPEPMREPLTGVENLLGVYIPQDLLRSNQYHPLRMLFNNKVINAMVDHAFLVHPGQGFRAKYNTQPGRAQSQSSQITATFRLLRALYDRGMYVRHRGVLFSTMTCLINIYGPVVPVDASQRTMRMATVIPLRQMKMLIDEGWGDELLRPMHELVRIIRAGPPRAEPEERNHDDESRHHYPG